MRVEEFTATYEGGVRPRSDALITSNAAGFAVIDEGLNASFCSAGIQDMDLAMEAGRGLGVTSPEDLAVFARRHADYVQIVGDLLEEDDPYWRAGGASCGAELFESADDPAALAGRALCDQFFQPAEVESVQRDFRIVEAREDQLVLEPRSVDPNTSEVRKRLLSEFAACCFPKPTAYQVRAGHQWIVRGSATGFSHAVTTDPTSLRCVADCSPLAERQRGRAYEISCNDGCPLDPQQQPVIGYAVDGQDVACRVDSAADGIDPGEPGSECVFQSLTGGRRATATCASAGSSRMASAPSFSG